MNFAAETIMEWPAPVVNQFLSIWSEEMEWNEHMRQIEKQRIAHQN